MYNHYKLNKTIIFIFLFITLLIAYFFNENSSGGAYPDFLMRVGIINSFNSDFYETFLNYDNFPDRHSPLILILISGLYKIGFDLDSVRFLHLFLVPCLVIITYKCFLSCFGNKYNNIFFLIASTIFLSPIIRSISIWPDSRLLGLLFFISSLFYFLEFKKKQKYQYCIYNTVLLILSSYISPNFAVFFLYFFYYYFKHYHLSKKLFVILFINLVLSLPMIFYLFILNVNFLLIPAINEVHLKERLNPANKILIISTLVFFYYMPILLEGYVFKLLKRLQNFKNILITVIFFIILAFFFSYSFDYTGGGIFFKLSHILFKNDYFFLIISLVSMLFISQVFTINFNNILLFLILIISNPHLTIYHKYYDPLLMVLFFTLFQYNFDIKKIINTKLVINFYSFSIFFLIVNYLRSAF